MAESDGDRPVGKVPRPGLWTTGLSVAAALVTIFGGLGAVIRWLSRDVAWAVLVVGGLLVVLGVIGVVQMWSRRSRFASIIVVLAVAVFGGGAAVSGGAVTYLADPGAQVDPPTGRPIPSPSPADDGVPVGTDDDHSEPTGQPTDGVSPPPQTGPDAPEGEPRVKRVTGDTPIIINSGYAIDLDSDAEDWGVQSASTAGSDLRLYAAYIWTSSDVVFTSGEPDFETCFATTDLHRHVTGDNLRAGMSFCIRRTTAGHVAWVTIETIESRRVVLHATVWEVPS